MFYGIPIFPINLIGVFFFLKNDLLGCFEMQLLVLLVSVCLINLAFYVGGVLFFFIYLNVFKSFIQYIILHSLFLNNKCI